MQYSSFFNLLIQCYGLQLICLSVPTPIFSIQILDQLDEKFYPFLHMRIKLPREQVVLLKSADTEMLGR